MTKEKNLIVPEEEIIDTEPGAGEPGAGEKERAIEETGVSDKYLSHLDYVAGNIDRFVAAKQKIWTAILKLAKDGDWVVFESEDKNSPTGKRASVCLSGAGADRIASSIGISFSNWKEKKETGEDKKGAFYRYWFEADCSWGGRTVKVMGRAGSRDKFFGMAYGQLKEISDIDESNIKMAAFHNCLKEGVKIILGLRNIPISDFEKAGIKLNYARRFAFAGRKETPAPVRDTVPEVQVDREPGSDDVKQAPSATCRSCNAAISAKVADFSKRKLGVPLCMDCQKKGK